MRALDDERIYIEDVEDENDPKRLEVMLDRTKQSLASMKYQVSLRKEYGTATDEWLNRTSIAIQRTDEVRLAIEGKLGK